jgi:hypothetical protein
MVQQMHELVAEQAIKIGVDCDRAAIRDSLISARWESSNFWLGIASAVAAAVAAFCVGNSGDILTASSAPGDAKTYANVFASGAALFSAILASILTFLAPSAKATTYHQFSNKYHSLRDRIRSFVRIHCIEGISADDLKKRFESLLEEKRSIDADHPVVPERYYRKAVEKMEEKIKRNQRITNLEEEVERSKVKAIPHE